ncbi:hypothetical protein [Tepidibacillus marianensis]|uniref:hypothetical protein n=1 Tax=Tepidibacillus marianensis TaxID=3131995 RepID=UPI0030D0FB13
MNSQIASGTSLPITFQNSNLNSGTNIDIAPVSENVIVDFLNLLNGLKDQPSLLQPTKQELEFADNNGLSNGSGKSQENTKQDKSQNDFVNSIMGSLFQIPLASQNSVVIQTVSELPMSQLQVLEQLLKPSGIQGVGIELQGSETNMNEVTKIPKKPSADSVTVETSNSLSNMNQDLSNAIQPQALPVIEGTMADSIQKSDIATVLNLISSEIVQPHLDETIQGNQKSTVMQGPLETQEQIQQLLAQLGIQVEDKEKFLKSVMNTPTNIDSVNDNIETVQSHTEETAAKILKSPVVQDQMKTRGISQQLQQVLSQLGILLGKIEIKKALGKQKRIMNPSFRYKKANL